MISLQSVLFGFDKAKVLLGLNVHSLEASIPSFCGELKSIFNFMLEDLYVGRKIPWSVRSIFSFQDILAFFFFSGFDKEGSRLGMKRYWANGLKGPFLLQLKYPSSFFLL
jgi:hypothetical protein